MLTRTLLLLALLLAACAPAPAVDPPARCRTLVERRHLWSSHTVKLSGGQCYVFFSTADKLGGGWLPLEK